MIAQLLTGQDDTRSAGLRLRMRTLLVLTGVEARRLLLHPLAWAGLLLSVLYAWYVLHGKLPVVPADLIRLAATAGPLAVGTLLAANLGTLRPARHGTVDVYSSVPVGASLRTMAMLGASLAGAVLGLVFALAGVAYLYAIGGTGTAHAADVLAIPALVVTAGFLGVAVARWVPRVFAGAIAAVMFVGLQLWFDSGAGRLPRLVLAADWGASISIPFEVLHRSPVVHLLYVFGVATLLAAVAMLRHGANVKRTAAGLAGAGTVAITVLAMLPPISSAEADRLLGMAGDADGLNRCVDVDQVTYCAPPLYHGWVDHWHTTVTGVLQALPDAERPAHFKVRMVSEISPPDLGPMLPGNSHERIIATAEQLDGWHAAPRSSPREILVHRHQHRGSRGDEDALALAVATVSDTLGLGGLTPIDTPAADQDEGDTDADEDGDAAELSRCAAAGQAREVVALYLASVNNPAAQRALRREIDQRPYQLVVFPMGTMVDEELFLNGEAFDANQAAVWSRSGATLTLQLLEQPAEDVLARLHDRWDHWTNPTTPRDEMVRTFGLEPLPTVEQLAEEADVDPSQLDEAALADQAMDVPTCR